MVYVTLRGLTQDLSTRPHFYSREGAVEMLQLIVDDCVSQQIEQAGCIWGGQIGKKATDFIYIHFRVQRDKQIWWVDTKT